MIRYRYPGGRTFSVGRPPFRLIKMILALAMTVPLFGVACPGSGSGSGSSGGYDTWIRAFGGGGADFNARDVGTTESGDFVVAGTWKASEEHGWAARITDAGDVLWSRRYSPGSPDLGITATQGMSQSADGGFVVVGPDESGTPLVVKVDAGGNVVWQTNVGGAAVAVKRMRPADDGGYILAGTDTAVSPPDQGKNPWIARLGADGTVMLTHTLVLPDDEGAALDAWRTSDGGFIVAGYSDDRDIEALGHGKDAYIAKLTATGNVIAEVTLGFNAPNHFTTVRQAQDGGFFAVGVLFDPDLLGLDTDTDLLAIKYDADLNEQWDGSLDSDDNIDMVDVELSSDGGFVVAGGRDGNGQQPFLVKYDADGSVVFTQVLSTGKAANSILASSPTASGGFTLGVDDSFVVQVDSNGAAYQELDLTSAGLTVEQAEPVDDGDSDPVRDDGFIVRTPGGLARVADDGTVMWQRKTAKTVTTEQVYSLAVASDESSVLVGSTISADGPEPGTLNAIAVHLSAGGQPDWALTYSGGGDDTAYAAASGGDGFFVGGESGGDPWVAAVDGDGIERWQTRLQRTSFARITSIVPLSDGGVLVAGPTGGDKAWIGRLTSTGEADTSWSPWERVYDVGGGSGVSEVRLHDRASGGTLMLATTFTAEAHVAALDSTGNVVWSVAVPNEDAAGVAAMSDGACHLATSVTTNSGGMNIATARIEGDGATCWQKIYGTGGTDVARAVTPTADGGFAVLGYTDGYSSPNFDAWILNFRLDGTFPDTCVAYLTPDPDDLVFGGGVSRSTADESTAPVELTPLTRSNAAIFVDTAGLTVAASCQAIGTDAPGCGSAAPCAALADITGTWEEHWSCTGTCAPGDSGVSTFSVVQTGSSVTASDNSGFDIAGTMSGNVFTWSGGEAEYNESGTWTFSCNNTALSDSDWISKSNSSCGGHCVATLTKQ